jgi:hypothetical protein
LRQEDYGARTGQGICRAQSLALLVFLHGRLCVRRFQSPKDIQRLVGKRAPNKTGQISRSMSHA